MRHRLSAEEATVGSTASTDHSVNGHSACRYCACPIPRGHGISGTYYSPKMKTPNCTRVQAPETPVAGGLKTHTALMKGTGQSSNREACSRKPTGLPVTPPKKHPASGKWNLRNSTKIATWNVLTLRKTGYQVALSREMARLNIDIVGLTETRITDNGRRDVNDSTMLFSGATTHTQGVALLLRENTKRALTSWSPISPRLLTARLTHRHGHLFIVVAYAPTEDSSMEDKDSFYDQLHSILDTVPPHDQLVLLGDLNAVSGTSRDGFEQVVGNFGSGVPNDNTYRLLTLCATYGLAILGSWFQRRNIHRFTWFSNDGRTVKEIDHIITRDRRSFTACRVYRSAECPANTDHRLLVAKMRIRLCFTPKTTTDAVKYNIDRLMKCPITTQKFAVTVSNKFEALSSLQSDVEQEWSAISSALRESAEEVVGRRRPTRKPWLSEDTLEIVKKKSEARQRGDKQQRNLLRRLFDKKAREDKENFYNNTAKEAELGIARNDLKATYRAIKIFSGSRTSRSCDVPVNDLQGSPCKTEDSILQRWAEHYEKALNHSTAQNSQELNDMARCTTQDPSIKEDPPTLLEVKMAIQKLRNGRAAGSDHLPAELLKCALDPVSKALHRLFHKVWQSGMVPTEWKDGIVVSLYKGKGSRSECNSYRPITLLSVPGKVFAHILLARLNPLLHSKRRPQQSGFTKSRSTLDAILALRLLSELHREFQKPLHVAYIDLKAAFDSVDRAALWKAIQGIGVPKILLGLIQELHNGTTARVRLGQRLSPPFATSSGVRQGCVLAPALFCRAMDFIMDNIAQRIGIRIGTILFSDTNYADDAAFFVERYEDYETALRSMESEASKLGLHVSWNKTKIQNLGFGPTGDNVLIDNNTVEAVTDFSYLGSIQSSCSNSATECQRRIGLAASTMKNLSRVWSQKKLRIQTKFRVYSTCVLPILLYGSETWTLPQRLWDKLQAFHMRCQRRILRIKWSDYVSNIKVSERSCLKDLHTIVRKRRLGLFGHVARLPDDAPAKQALAICCKVRDGIKPATGWKRPRGRPHTTWTHQIHRDTGITATEALQLTGDRRLWRTIATADSKG